MQPKVVQGSQLVNRRWLLTRLEEQEEKEERKKENLNVKMI
jgi:hypothetical protein